MRLMMRQLSQASDTTTTANNKHTASKSKKKRGAKRLSASRRRKSSFDDSEDDVISSGESSSSSTAPAGWSNSGGRRGKHKGRTTGNSTKSIYRTYSPNAYGKSSRPDEHQQHQQHPQQQPDAATSFVRVGPVAALTLGRLCVRLSSQLSPGFTCGPGSSLSKRSSQSVTHALRRASTSNPALAVCCLQELHWVGRRAIRELRQLPAFECPATRRIRFGRVKETVSAVAKAAVRFGEGAAVRQSEREVRSFIKDVVACCCKAE